MTTQLYLYNQEERYDLAEWLRSHDGERDYPAGMTATADWLCGVPVVNYPAWVDVPPEHVEPLDVMIDDWCELLAAHDEAFCSHLRPTP